MLQIFMNQTEWFILYPYVYIFTDVLNKIQLNTYIQDRTKEMSKTFIWNSVYRIHFLGSITKFNVVDGT